MGVDLARLLLDAQANERAIEILERSQAGFVQLGKHDLAQQVQTLIDRARSSTAPGDED